MPSQTPILTALPTPPPGDFLNETQWRVLYALLDGAFPSITSASGLADKDGQIILPDDELDHVLENALASLAGPATKQNLQKFLEERPSEDLRFRENVLRTLSVSPQYQQRRLSGFLSLMATRPGSFLLTSYWQPVYNQTTQVREAILKSWVAARTVRMRTLGKTITTLALKSASHTNKTLHELSGYSDTPQDWKPGQGFDFEFLQFESSQDVQVLNTDVVIVGSGCGGGVSAKILAEAGHKVLVVDKSYHFPPSQLPMPQDAGCNYLYDNNGFYITEDSGCNVSAGSAWGGGGTINWSVCLRLQDSVRKEWADTGLSFFASPEFDQCVDRVWEAQGAGTGHFRHNHRNQVLLNGSKKLGWVASETPLNTAGQEHFCGHCHLGCGSAEKRGPAQYWLPDAAQAGAKFMEGFHVDKVLFQEDGQTAIGVEGEWTSRDTASGTSGPGSERVKRRIVIRAKKVIMAAGALWSPMVLIKSGIQNQHLGSNLHLHPCNIVTAVYKEETRPWEGGITTSVCSEFENLDGAGHGVKLETTCMLPYAVFSTLPWKSGLDAKLEMAKYRHTDGWVSITRDRDAGRVFPDPTTGRPRIDYTPSDYDRAHTLQGVQSISKLCYVTGATEIRPLLTGLEPFIRSTVPSSSENPLKAGSPITNLRTSSSDLETKDPETSDPAFAAWLARVRDVSNKPPATMWSSAHQMGTCRMSASPDGGVVDDKGRVWGTHNLYVADGSVFPSASGVNPMVTIMAIADWISRGVDADLKAQ
ncbi:hypothetical protein EDB81DRAFT_635537 [Dactylonectria macrodidyma]|uniref:Long-chain-alcohol oxidase n=1 Tax=Dactylonectria macrodidyma TaxID=307937 RepID=A0A9P9FRP2_9HYPO|nr:hypothetical protein EDB81DRAFT_635537 [Dactylonectria macrodidyma]